MFQTTMNFLAPPKNITAELLKGLIEKPYISERMFNYNSFRIRLTELRKELEERGVTIKCNWKEFVNGFGRKGKYKEHYLLTIDREKAVEVYNKINQ